LTGKKKIFSKPGKKYLDTICSISFYQNSILDYENFFLSGRGTHFFFENHEIQNDSMTENTIGIIQKHCFTFIMGKLNLSVFFENDQVNKLYKKRKLFIYKIDGGKFQEYTIFRHIILILIKFSYILTR